MIKLFVSKLKRPKTQLIISTGSERSEYVSSKYIFSQFDRIHDGIQLMKTYYPNSEFWNPRKKISECSNKKNVSFAWDYEYDNYHPLDIFEEDSVTLKQLEDVKQYGADVHLTLTLDLSLSDAELKSIFEVLGGYGRIYLRINHECNGSWFRFNRVNTYQEVSKFFVRCHNLIKLVSPNIFTVFCLAPDNAQHEGVVLNRNTHLSDDELKEALKIADFWSLDKYASLNYGWPFAKVTPGVPGQYWIGTVDEWWKNLYEHYISMIWNNDLVMKPLFINEFNSDSDVHGYGGQADFIRSVYSRLHKGDLDFIKGFVLYQFRDFGGLGLELDKQNGEIVKLPALNTYKEMIHKFKYNFDVEPTEFEHQDFSFQWADCDSIKGIRVINEGIWNAFKNEFEIPVFMVIGQEQIWKRLEPGQSIDLEGHREFDLFIPPFKNLKGVMQTSKEIYDIREKINNMFEYRQNVSMPKVLTAF